MKVKTTRKNRKPTHKKCVMWIPKERTIAEIKKAPKREKITYQEFCKRLLQARTTPYANQFTNLDLSNITLEHLDLRGVQFNNVDFSRTELHNVRLVGASFYKCNLKGTAFRQSDLTSSRFQFCLLDSTTFWYTEMKRVSMLECTATNTKNTRLRARYTGETLFFACNLSRAYFYGNHLTNPNFCDSPMNDATLSANEFINPKHLIPLVCPSHGSFTAFKKVYTKNGSPIIAKLTIPARAERSSSTGRKCRASEAKVMGFYDLEGKRLSKEEVPYACSIYARKFRYYVGKTVYPKNSFDDDRWEECASGIHFFVTFQEAVEYNT